MTQRAWLATRKGVFELNRLRDGWSVGRASFLGEPVSMVLPPSTSAPMLAALNLGHFGVKVHASDDNGATRREVATPSYPPQPEGAQGPAWKLVQIWSLQRHGDTVWAGTLPGGLFRSRDAGESWQLVESLWNRPERSRVVRRRLRRSRHPFDLPAPVAQRRAADRRKLRRRMGDARRRRNLGAASQGHAR